MMARWPLDRALVILLAVSRVAHSIETFKALPPRQKPGSFGLDQLLQMMPAGPKAN